MRDFRKLPNEKIVKTDALVTAFNTDMLDVRRMERVALLACGHHVITRNLKSAHCPRCQHMVDTGQDWDAFRHLKGSDTMAWPDDPCRALNEPANNGGHFIRDLRS